MPGFATMMRWGTMPGIIGMKVPQGRGTYAAKWFLNSERIEQLMDAAVQRAYMRFGGAVRKHAQYSIRHRRGTSAPGTPPYSHVGLLKRHIYFAFDPMQQSVVIGPALLNMKSEYGSTTVPELMEYGGRVRRMIRGRHSGKRVLGGRFYEYRARPFMGPAFEAEKERLPDFWAQIGGR